MSAQNPYDHEDTCHCSAWSEGECACGGYVDRGKVRAWQQGYDAAVADLTGAVSECSNVLWAAENGMSVEWARGMWWCDCLKCAPNPSP